MKNLFAFAKKAAIWISSIALVLFIWITFYIAGPVKGSVVDQATGKPIEGAIVAIAWPAVENGWMSAISAGKVHLKETLTDEKGEFFFWPWIDFYGFKISINTSRPELIAAKSGFAPMLIASSRSTPVDVGSLVENQGNLKLQFKLAPVKIGLYNYTAKNGFGDFSITPDLRSSDVCNFEKKSPKLKNYIENHDYSGMLKTPMLDSCIK
jgi:hypothetical protein